jgi:hypothetical protein
MAQTERVPSDPAKDQRAIPLAYFFVTALLVAARIASLLWR